MKKLSSFNLRPHHSLCISFFKGNGYDESFVKNMTAVIECLNIENPVVTLTNSCNDVLCEKCPNNKAMICADNNKAAAYDKACLDEYNLNYGDKIEWLTLKKLAESRIISQGKLEKICHNCEWKCYDIET